MAAHLPYGLIRVVSATHAEEPLEPADVLYERERALYNFWRVYSTQARTTHNVSSIRCRQLFWRLWGNPSLSLSLSQSTIMRLWQHCQRDLDLTPFELRIESSSSSALQSVSSSATQFGDTRPTRESHTLSIVASISPTHMISEDASYNDDNSKESSKESSKDRHTSRATGNGSESRPGLNRTPSGDTTRKRSNVSSTAGRTRVRPALPRKRSSQAAQQSLEAGRTRRSIIKSPQSSTEEQAPPTERRISQTTVLAQQKVSPRTVSDTPQRRISAFELPSASSWQSVDSEAGTVRAPAVPSASYVHSRLIDENFRERFVESQKQLKSSTDLTSLGRAMRKTGSVVRFADEVDIPEELRNMRRPLSPQLRTMAESRSLLHRSATNNQNDQACSANAQPSSSVTRRVDKFQRHDSTGSVAAVSDDGSDEAAASVMLRTKSQLSLAVADLRRSRSLGEQDRAGGSGSMPAVTSPEIEEEQQALISGKKAKRPSEEEKKLLAMGRKDGVTRAGGVNLPRQLTVKGKFKMPDDDFEGPEEPLY